MYLTVRQVSLFVVHKYLLLFRSLGEGLGCVLIKSTLGSGKTQKGGMHGSNGGQRGQFTSNLEPRRTIPVTAGGCQVSRGGDIKGKCYVQTVL
jgi:hypothetical protein